MTASTREVVVDDAVAFLRGRAFAGCSIVSSIPDVSETGMAMPAWLVWFADVARLLVEKLPDDGLLVLTQTDIRKEGRWIDKSFLVQRAALEAGAVLLSRKIICRKPAGSVSTSRAAFTHLLVFSRGKLVLDPLRPEVVPDVLADGGQVTWTRGLGERAALACVDVVVRYAPSLTVVDPFCGEGMVLAAANHRGRHALGCERNSKRAAKARTLVIKKARD
jgi:hypothetical protein